MSSHKCGRRVEYVMPRAMGIGSIVCDIARNPHPATDSDVWARLVNGCGLYECPPSSFGAARYRLHECERAS